MTSIIGKWCRNAALLLLGAACLPMTVAAALAIFDILPELFVSEFPWIDHSPLAILIGYGAWSVLFLVLPPNMKVYVVGHELTHAVWGMITGSKVGRIHVTDNGGFVNISNPGVFTTLAPYFVPFYTLVALLLRISVGFFVDMEPYSFFWLILFGFTYGFHVTYTLRSLSERQPDLIEYGRLFSYTLILFFNIVILGYGIVAATCASLPDYHAALLSRVVACYGWVWCTVILKCWVYFTA